jgi:uncharacterized protein
MIEIRIVAVFFIALNVTPVFAGPLEDADAAERRDDYAVAIPIYRALADKGNAVAQSRLGFFYNIGVGVKQDYLEAAKWYSKAFEAGDQGAAGQLAGIGRNWRILNLSRKDYPIIYGLVEKAAQKGSPVAQFSLGVMNYPIGDLTFDERGGNLSEALIWYRRAADQGDVDSEVALGIAYADGIGVPQDYVEAHKWFNVAAPRTKYGDIRADIMKRRDELALKMTPSQIAEAQKLARDWKPNKQP